MPRGCEVSELGDDWRGNAQRRFSDVYASRIAVNPNPCLRARFWAMANSKHRHAWRILLQRSRANHTIRSPRAIIYNTGHPSTRAGEPNKGGCTVFWMHRFQPLKGLEQ